MSRFIQICDEIIETLASGKGSQKPSKFDALQDEILATLTEATTMRTDTLGNKVTIPPGYSFKIGPDGIGIAVGPCDAVKTDRVGRFHAVPRGYVLKIGRNGKGVVVPRGDATKETKDGQVQIVKPPKKAGC
jgi:hypothetical protein